MAGNTKCIAMLLAGGQGSRLGVLTKSRAKPAVPFGGKYRIIDFTLSNCVNSGVSTVGVLTQYQPLELNDYIGNGQPWDLDRMDGGVHVLPPYQHRKGADWYSGTVNAIYQNIPFIDRYNPDYLLVLGGDHIYKMDYAKMLAFHREKQADCTIAGLVVPKDQASRFGIMNTNGDNSIYEFEEKPARPKSNFASMGIYIFSWKKLRAYMTSEEGRKLDDFGKHLIPAMLEAGERIFAYPFEGYWKDVGTVESYWQSNMDMLNPTSGLNMHDPNWRIYARSAAEPPHYTGCNAVIRNSIVAEGCSVDGTIYNSVLFCGAKIEAGAVVRDSIVLPGAIIRAGAKVQKAVIGETAIIGENTIVGFRSDEIGKPVAGITVVGDGVHVGRSAIVMEETMLDADIPEVKAV
ncbi:glucose-1-phosphate adenylyltransferase [Ethanoligenens harbinense]|uniref:Glucose-1-phosphate adenylyltransferase n=1 Tax=Ethanoligenens harbinense (strain DSM 18485 / JCM 12961 / CGMCC 1.5033 / YUAN-3) TaxID=663278 RepID=E6U339_ETHHY|nr:glucose-1-phosphate adenylyltransferase [Ethanoligenens harbinense]ADU27511.1 glucose-1-phosphate adenylyltransferase [Ethanoligenens harbinense YUAN-3]AVQ96564.1 glucose-1-phosphate adenylyltransferase [Ethanoligenens harbinense YUAN-3]AYF39225.1 glucose-1-phosphate adenylyltransferase [Ethanoligenens harbinense]AYF42049.1 glucose-1-phosphate adenylyltransferase [Ethanoligenens harbinense]QCN92804.1 glucose-1-phosphate adenylyltransferase [Ethanoligenens harbinense]